MKRVNSLGFQIDGVESKHFFEEDNTDIVFPDIEAFCEGRTLHMEHVNSLGFQIDGDELKRYCEEDDKTDIVIPDQVTWIDDWAFENCSKLTSVSIPESVTWIGDFAFSGCTGLTSIIIPSNVTHIGSSAFDGCTSLRFITIQNPRINIGPGAFKGTPFLEKCADDFVICGNVLIRYKGKSDKVIIPDGVLNIGGWSFWQCTNVSSVILPDSLKVIDENAFRECTSLESINIPDGVEYLSDRAFLGCEALESISIPNSVTSIGASAFYGCRKLKSICIPSSVTEFGFANFEGYYTFEGCSSLASITIRNITLNKATLDYFRKQDESDSLSMAIVLIAHHYYESVFCLQPKFIATVVWTAFDLYPDDAETLYYIGENFIRVFPFLLDTDNAVILQKVFE